MHLLLLQITEINEAPVFLLLNPKIDLTRKDLPVALYETGEHAHHCATRSAWNIWVAQQLARLPPGRCCSGTSAVAARFRCRASQHCCWAAHALPCLACAAADVEPARVRGRCANPCLPTPRPCPSVQSCTWWKATHRSSLSKPTTLWRCVALCVCLGECVHVRAGTWLCIHA